MGSCCDKDVCIDVMHTQQRSTLVKVLWINAIMFVAIVSAAFYGKSTALLSDSLDNLGDALTYGLSLYVIHKDTGTKAKVALFKGGLIFLAAGLVMAQVIYKIMNPVVPSYEVMSIFSIAGLVANGLCLYLLWRHRDEDINMSSVFECSRNDVASNLSVVLAAIGVWYFNSGVPDIVIAALLALFLLRSSAKVILTAKKELFTNN